MNRLKRALRQIPGLATTYWNVRGLGQFVHEAYFSNVRRRMENCHERKNWDFSTPAELERYRLILSALASELGDATWGDALEVGCADGIFTEQIASRCVSVTACDISQLAIERAIARCAGCSNINLQRCDIADTPVGCKVDLVFAMDCLEFIRDPKRLSRAATTLVGALKPGGYLTFSGSRWPTVIRSTWWARMFRDGADNIADYLKSDFGLNVVFEAEYEPGNSVPGYVDHILLVLQKPKDSSA